MDRHTIRAHALELEPAERALLIDELLGIYDQEKLKKAWAAEGEARIDAFERGEMEAYSYEEVMDEASRI